MDSVIRGRQTFTYHHSCHGSTTLHNLLVDKDRPKKYIIHKYLGEKVESQSDEEFYDLSYSQILQILDENGYDQSELDELFLKHKEEFDSIPYVDHILGVPEGITVEIHLKIRGEQGQTVLTSDFSADPKNVEFKPRLYHDYIVMKVLGVSGNMGQVLEVYTKLGKRKDVFFDLHKGIVVNLPNIEFSYIATFEVGLLEIVKDERGKPVIVADDEDDPIRYTGCSYTMDREGYFHSFSKEKEEESLLNALFRGTTKPTNNLQMGKKGGKPWHQASHEQYVGIVKDLDPSAKSIVVNINGSHCLSPQEFSEHGLIGNVVPFMIDSCPQWAEIFKKELVTASVKEVKYQKDELDDKVDDLVENERIRKRLKSTIKRNEKELTSKPMKETSQKKFLASAKKIQDRLDLAIERLEELDEEYEDLLDEVYEGTKKVDKAVLVQQSMKKVDKMELGPVTNTKRRGSLTKKKKRKKNKNKK